MAIHYIPWDGLTFQKSTVTEFNQLAFELNHWNWVSRSFDTIQLPSSVASCSKRGYKECSMIINFPRYGGQPILQKLFSSYTD